MACKSDLAGPLFGSGSESSTDKDCRESRQPTTTVSIPDGPDILEICSPAAALLDNGSSGNEAPQILSEDGPSSPVKQCKMDSRAYQLEMLDRSLKQNVIVAMDTGSGKTQVAVLRMTAELETCALDKIVWLLAPTVSLCEQHFESIRPQTSAVSMKVLTGNLNIDAWSKTVWEAVLNDTRIIISTYQILLDALSHGFVTMGMLALIVFDEAHNCLRKSPGSKIMVDFYRKSVRDGGSTPSILGLTASPSIKASGVDIENLEATLDAICVSPTLHREELLKHVKRPQIRQAIYNPSIDPRPTRNMYRLQRVCDALNIEDDPYVRQLKADPTDRNMRALSTAIAKEDTYTFNQLKGLKRRCVELLTQLGSWAAERYLWRAVAEFNRQMEDREDGPWPSEDRIYLAQALREASFEAPTSEPQRLHEISHKAQILVRELRSIGEAPVGIVFVQERATAVALKALLATSPSVCERYRIGCMVGTSNHLGRQRNVYDLHTKADALALQNFRSGKVNLLIATSVLEEGIDIPACNFVICFDPVRSLKAFVQRRGRARTRESTLILFQEANLRYGKDWEALEQEIKRQCLDEERDRARLEILEDSEETSSTCFVVESTGARVDFDNAKPHLEHFCRVLSQGEFLDNRPDYVLSWQEDISGSGLSARVLLPAFLPVELREVQSRGTWRTEKNAKKDAAFQAYVALYRAGLLSDHLLPFKTEDQPSVEGRAAIVEVDQPLSPWIKVANAWRQEASHLWTYGVTCHDQTGTPMGTYDITIPAQLHRPRNMTLFLNPYSRGELRFEEARLLSQKVALTMADHTSALLAFHFSHRWPVESRNHVIHTSARQEDLAMSQIGSLSLDLNDQRVKDGTYFIRDSSRTPFLYDATLPSKPPAELVQSPFYDYEKAPENVPYVAVKKWTKRSDFLHPSNDDVSKNTPSAKPYERVIPVSQATVDSVRVRHAHFGMLIPSIIHEFEVMLVAKELASTVLQPVGFNDLNLVREAISARSAAEPFNYERLELLGDSILKFCTAVQVSAEHPKFPEGYLSFFKDRLVANSRLSRAALQNNLSKFILTRPFTGQKWRPLYNDDMLKSSPNSKRRQMSTKTLADVVEALIGASYRDGGTPKALRCIALFLDELEWRDNSRCRDILFQNALELNMLPPTLAPLETILGYSFQKKALLVEAVTHGSHAGNTSGRSLERLEFLGDAILDYIIVTKLMNVEPPLPHQQMHLLKTAVVNGDYLGFIALSHGLAKTATTINASQEVEATATFLPMWKFLRHASTPIGLAQDAVAERFEQQKREIFETIEHGMHYPWAQFARLQAKKFLSDMVESLLGAVWVDSGSMEECERLVARLGITGFLDRILREGVHVEHPKEELGKWAVAETVTYSIDVLEEEDGERSFTCQVSIGKRAVAEVTGGVSREEVKTKAAAEAVRVLAEERDGMTGTTKLGTTWTRNGDMT